MLRATSKMRLIIRLIKPIKGTAKNEPISCTKRSRIMDGDCGTI